MTVVEQHSWYHCYRFTRSSTGMTEMYYKQYSRQPWLPNKDSIQLPGDQILIVCVYDGEYNCVAKVETKIMDSAPLISEHLLQHTKVELEKSVAILLGEH